MSRVSGPGGGATHSEVGRFPSHRWRLSIPSTQPGLLLTRRLPSGQRPRGRIRERIEAMGMTVESLLDLNLCDPETKWSSLSPEDADVLGLACVIRTPVMRKELPQTAYCIIPTNREGYVSIPRDVAESYLSVADPEKIPQWHSRAADFFVDFENYKERIYHLSGAGRHTEACKLLKKHKDELLWNPSEDLLRIVSELLPLDGSAGDIEWVAGETAFAIGRLALAKRFGEKLAEYGDPRGDIVLAQVALGSGQFSVSVQAMRVINDLREATEATLKIERDGEIRDILFSLSQ